MATEPNIDPGSLENRELVAVDYLTRYDAEGDIFHCWFGVPQPAAPVTDPTTGIILRVDPNSRQIVGFSIPDFVQWCRENTDPEDDDFHVELPDINPNMDLPEAE